MWDDSIPEVQRTGGVAAAEAGDQVVFVGGDGAFCRIVAVEVQRNDLEGNTGILHDLFEAGWALVVEHLNVRRKTTVG